VSTVRDLVVTENMTLDGVIDGAGGWFGPAEDADDDLTDEVTRQRHAADAFLTGRVTFEEMRGYWPQVRHDTTGIAAYLDRVDKYVVSTTLDDPQWQHTTVLGSLDEVADLKTVPGGDIVATGSIALVHALLEAALVNELRLFVHPRVMGSGRRLFDGAVLPRLTLQEARSFRSGITLLRYRIS
jgi:dihydrofolate reductase